MKPSAKWRATFFIFKNQKEGPQKRNIWERGKPICYAFKARNIRLPKTEHCVFFSLPPKVTFLGITHFFYNCLHTHIRFTLPACLRPERFLSLCKSSYLFSGLACVKLLTISRRELIRNAAYFIKHYTVSHFAIFSPPQSATQIEIRLTLLKHSCESSRRWKNVFGISAHVFFLLA